MVTEIKPFVKTDPIRTKRRLSSNGARNESFGIKHLNNLMGNDCSLNYKVIMAFNPKMKID
jgi:hypothetical protein